MKAVLDSSALLVGKYPELDEMMTTPDVIRELKRKGMSPGLKSFVDVKVRIASPSEAAVRRVMEASTESGDSERLSETDLGLLALALDEDAILLTDDYSIQNLATMLGLCYRGVMFPEITKKVSWRYRCEGCGRRFDDYSEICSICGSKVRTYRKKEEEIEKKK
ncbi:MAG: NOB1 family endonuclease [Thermoplasmata archaeon]